MYHDIYTPIGRFRVSFTNNVETVKFAETGVFYCCNFDIENSDMLLV